MKIQYYHRIVLSLIVSVTAMIMSESVASAAPKAWVEMSSGTDKSLNGIWGTSATDIFVVGSSGTILHYGGTSWTMTSVTGWLAGVWGSSSSNVFVAGSTGTILHYDGIDWTTMTSNTTEDLAGIWGSSANEVFAVGGNGTILYYDGSGWSSMTSNTSKDLSGIWGSSSTNIFAVGLEGTILHYDGSGWSEVTGKTTKNLYSIWGNSNNNIFAVGQDGTILRYNGSDWTAMTSNTTKHLYSVWGSANDNIFAIGLDTSLHYDGSDWISLGPGTSGNYLGGVWGADCAECKFIVGEQGKILQLAPALTISTAGNGTGTVTATAGLNDGFSDCDTTCKEYYSVGDSVEITAAADSSSNFTGWSGDCSGTTNPLTVTMNTSLNCTATFDLISHSLAINKSGTGIGTVTSSDGGVNCGSVCSKDYPQGTSVTLTATPQNGSTFTGWSGDCSSSNNSVTLTMDNSFTCTAKFDVIPQQTLSINKTGTGTGTVTGSNGMNCGSICSKNYQPGTAVTLTATPQNGSTFGGWSGDCSGSNNSITLTISNLTSSCTATFNSPSAPPSPPQKLTVIVTGKGKVSSKPQGIDFCEDNCTYDFDSGKEVELTPSTADPNWQFVSWSGDCNENGHVTMDNEKQCEAIFRLTISQELEDLIKNFQYIRIIYRYSDGSTRRGVRAAATPSPTPTDPSTSNCSQIQSLISSFTSPISDLQQIQSFIVTLNNILSLLPDDQIQSLISLTNQILKLLLTPSPDIQELENLMKSLISRLSSLTASQPCKLLETSFQGVQTSDWVQTVDNQELNQLRQDKNIVSIEIDRPLFASSIDDNDNLNLMGASSIDNLGYLGAGQVVAVLDTGIDSSDTDLQGHVEAGACFSTEDSSLNTVSICNSNTPLSGERCGDGSINECNHGTAVAKRILAVAPEAKVIPIQIFSKNESNNTGIGGKTFCKYWTGIDPPCIFAFTSNLIEGMNKVKSLKDPTNPNHLNIVAANLSLAYTVDNSTKDLLLFPMDCDNERRSNSIKTSVGNLSNSFIAPIMAAGNNESLDKILWPSCLSKVISVGATTGTGTTEAVAPYSNNASILDLLAPEFANTIPPSLLNGTSMATAYVSGAWAVLKQAKPDELIANIKNSLVTTGVQIRDARTINNGTTSPNTDIPTNREKPRIQIDAALAKLLCPNTTDTICVIGNGTVKSIGKYYDSVNHTTININGLINCGSQNGPCKDSSLNNHSITLIAIPDPGYTLVGWGRDCNGKDIPNYISGKNNVTQLTIKPDDTTRCIARFKEIPTTLSNWQEYPCFETPTIQSKGSINTPFLWNDNNNWEVINRLPDTSTCSTGNRVPCPDDVVLVKTDHEITVDQNPVQVKALCNYGKLESSDRDLVIEAHGGIKNLGIIQGASAHNVTLKTARVDYSDFYFKNVDKWWYTHDMNVIPGPIDNEGKIQGGDNNSGAAGYVTLLGRNVTNLGNGDSTADNPSGVIQGGDGSTKGGLVQVFGRFGGSTWGTMGNLISTGSIVAGDGTGTNGNGGNLWLVALPNVYLGPSTSQVSWCAPPSCTSHNAGQGNLPGRPGWVMIEPGFIEIAAGTEVKGGDITIFGGDDWTLKLSEQANIESYGDITLAVGKNSVIDLTGNTKRVLKAANQVKIFADDIRTDSGVTLADLLEAGNGIVQEPSKILYATTLVGPTQVNGQPGEVVPIRLTLINNGPAKDTYTLNVSDLSGWTFSPVTVAVEVPELDSVDIGITVTLPPTLGAENIITVLATSQADPSVKAVARTYAVVATEEMLNDLTAKANSLLTLLNQELPVDTTTVIPDDNDTTPSEDNTSSDNTAVEDNTTAPPPPANPLPNTIYDQAKESGIFNSVEATLDWLNANNLSPEDLTKEQLDALPITWQDPTAVEPLTSPEPEPIPEPELTTTQLDEVEQLLVTINRKDVLEQAEVESLNELSEELFAIAQTAIQNYQDAAQTALDQNSIEPLVNFETKVRPLQNKVTTIAKLTQSVIERLQIGEMFLSQKLINNATDEELANILGDQGLKAHAAAGMISTARSQAIIKLGIPAVNLDIFDSGNSCLLTPAPTSSLDSVLDLFFPKAEAQIYWECPMICANFRWPFFYRYGYCYCQNIWWPGCSRWFWFGWNCRFFIIYRIFWYLRYPIFWDNNYPILNPVFQDLTWLR
jgi:uncharacterized ubiquitin-like protein YukD